MSIKRFKTLEEIKAAVNAGETVHWVNDGYVVTHSNGDYLVKCLANDSCIGLTHRDGVTMNGKPEEFYRYVEDNPQLLQYSLAALTERERFFYDNAGFSYTPSKETEEEGRLRCAKALAADEEWAEKRGGINFSWEVDPLTDSTEFTDEQPAWSLWQCELTVEELEGQVGATLHGIDFGRGGHPDSDDYRRVVEAELIAEVREEVEDIDKEEEEETAQEQAYCRAAIEKYDNPPDVEVDEDDADVSISDGGAYVKAWVWVSDEEAGIESDDEE